MTILNQIQQDYQRFPHDQSYELYASDVYFKDPMTEFRGVDRYRQMIGFMAQWFRDIQLELHGIEQRGDRIETQWTLHWTSPLPWQPRIAISGWSELQLNAEGLIIAHIDHWHCSRWDVLKQHFG